MPQRPSVVLVVVDTLRADRTDRDGADGPVMPALEAFARDAWTFERAVAGAPLTMPSVAALMTGLYPDRAGVISHDRTTRLDCTSPTLAELARKAGYRTAAVVANPWLASRATRFDRGFDVYKTRRTQRLGAGRLDARAVTDLAIDEIQRTAAPVLLWVHYIDPHMPYQPPLEHAAAFGNPRGSSAIVRDFASEAVERETIYFQAPYDEAEIEATRRLYNGAARYVDGEIARLLAAVEGKLGRENTIVIITADHGESLGEHGLYFAHDFTLYEELAHVPLIVRLPGRQPARIAAPVALVDVLPTLCEHASLQCPGGLDGTLLAPETGSARPVFSVGPPFRARYARNPFIRVEGNEGRWAALRTGEQKLIRIPQPDGVRWEAYDLSTDPGESRNVYDARRHARPARLLESWLATQRAEITERGGDGRARLDKKTVEELRALGYLN